MTDKSITISIDAMGGDNAPSEIVKGAVLAVNKNSFLNIILVGEEDQIKNSLSMLGPSALEFIETNRITVVPSEGVIKDGEQPVVGFKKKPKSSIAISSYLVKAKKAHGLLSMGSTGATMAASALTMGMIKGIERPTVGGPIIGSSPNTVILDIGANVDSKPSQLVTFAVLGSIYSKHTFGIESPRVGILNVGSEEGKGNKLTKETFGLDKNRLYFTVFNEDEEALNLWKKITGLGQDKIIKIATSDNFWSMGETGPCGPCSEIFYDHGDHLKGGLPGTKDQDGDRYIEIWNLVFMQFEQISKDKRINLPKPSVDTGMGLERISALLQGTHDNYQTDHFRNIV